MNWQSKKFRDYKLRRLGLLGYLPNLTKEEARKEIELACSSFPITRYKTKTKKTYKKLVATDKIETSVLPMTLPVDEFWRIYVA